VTSLPATGGRRESKNPAIGGGFFVSLPRAAADLPQSVTLEAQKMQHPIVRPVDPFLDGHLLSIAVFVKHFLVAQLCAAGWLAAFGEHFRRGRIEAHQAAIAAIG